MQGYNLQIRSLTLTPHCLTCPRKWVSSVLCTATYVIILFSLHKNFQRKFLNEPKEGHPRNFLNGSSDRPQYILGTHLRLRQSKMLNPAGDRSHLKVSTGEIFNV